MKSPQTQEVDILNVDQISKTIEQSEPDFVINFAAYTDVQEAEKQKDDKEGICYKVNAQGAKNVADVCKDNRIHLIHISTDYVFDGNKDGSPYTEEDKSNPVNWYGMTKHFGDQFVLESGCPSTIVRISMPYTAHYEAKLDVARFFLSELRNGNKIEAIKDQRITPTFVDDISTALRVLIEKEEKGIYHVASIDYTSAFDFANLLAKTFELESSLIEQISLEEYNKNKLAKILRFSWLNPAKFVGEFGDGVLHTIEDSLKLFKQAGSNRQLTA